MADASAQASSTEQTVAARLARVAAHVRHCPVHELPHRAPIALAAHGLAVVGTHVSIAHPEGLRRPVVSVTLTVRDFAELHPPHTFTSLSDLNPTDAPAGHPVGSAVLDAAQLLWIVALGVDVAHPVSDDTHSSASFVADATAWERYLAQCLTRHHVRGAWRKHREAFERAGCLAGRRGSACDVVLCTYDAEASTRTIPQIAQWLDAADAVPVTESTAPRKPAPPRSAP